MRRRKMGPYRVKVQLRFFADEVTGAGEFCSGVAQLLQGIVDEGSLKRSATRMGMARSKAWKLIDDCERGLGYPLVTANAGSGSVLTPEGEKLLRMHQTLQAELDRSINARLSELLR
jgi:molybdate transport system regulatory protein